MPYQYTATQNTYNGLAAFWGFSGPRRMRKPKGPRGRARGFFKKDSPLKRGLQKLLPKKRLTPKKKVSKLPKKVIPKLPKTLPKKIIPTSPPEFKPKPKPEVEQPEPKAEQTKSTVSSEGETETPLIYPYYPTTYPYQTATGYAQRAGGARPVMPSRPPGRSAVSPTAAAAAALAAGLFFL